MKFDISQTLCAQLSTQGQKLSEKTSRWIGFFSRKGRQFVCHFSRSVCSVPQERPFPVCVLSGTPGALLWQQVTDQQRCSLSPITQPTKLVWILSRDSRGPKMGLSLRKHPLVPSVVWKSQNNNLVQIVCLKKWEDSSPSLMLNAKTWWACENAGYSN